MTKIDPLTPDHEDHDMTEEPDILAAAMASPRFWRAYAFDDADGFDVDQEGERIAAEIAGEEEEEVLVDMPATGRWRLRLRMHFDVTLHELCLATLEDDLDDDEEDEEDWLTQHLFAEYELGHWDYVRWHPWCLRWEEVAAVVQQMRANPARRSVSPEQAMLLLSRFVGHDAGDTVELTAHRQRVADQFTRLRLFDDAEARRVAAAMVIAPPDDDYAWSRSAEHGWVFGGAYSGYSNRNPAHSRFPFEQFAEFRAVLGLDRAIDMPVG